VDSSTRETSTDGKPSGSRRLDHPLSLIFACLGLAYLASIKGDLGDGARLLERTIALCRDWNNTLFTPNATVALGHVYACSGCAEGVPDASN
jgi:uncharacterized metal-binding protein